VAAEFDHRETMSHYEALLARVYSWMVGDLGAARGRAQAELARLGIGPVAGRPRALDLGAGIGLHAGALADLGYDVTALDSSAQLLGELARERPDVATVHGDLTAARKLVAGPFALIVCMGDTLTHLASPAAVWAAFAAARALLAPQGRLVLSFRDYSHARAGADRCFLVRADRDRLLTCCLAYEKNRVEVTDILHERVGAEWQMRVGVYHKLRLSIASLNSELEAAGLAATHTDETGGWLTIVASPAKKR
jgi:SAM-dependent methyltransferase